MFANRLRHQMTIQSRSTSLNAYREDTSSWATVRTVQAGIEPWPDIAQRREFAAAGATFTDTTIRVVMRYDDASDVTTRHRFLDEDGNVYDIKSIEHDRTMRRMLSFTCTSGSNQGGQ
jgi:SPP1 family predicted phage head-tail adaptor